MDGLRTSFLRNPLGARKERFKYCFSTTVMLDATCNKNLQNGSEPLVDASFSTSPLASSNEKAHRSLANASEIVTDEGLCPAKLRDYCRI